VAAIAHKLLPTARMFDATELADMLDSLEGMPPTHPAWPDVRDYVCQLLAELLDELTQWHAQTTATP
jgi:hypothetical protein